MAARLKLPDSRVISALLLAQAEPAPSPGCRIGCCHSHSFSLIICLQFPLQCTTANCSGPPGWSVLRAKIQTFFQDLEDTEASLHLILSPLLLQPPLPTTTNTVLLAGQLLGSLAGYLEAAIRADPSCAQQLTTTLASVPAQPLAEKSNAAIPIGQTV